MGWGFGDSRVRGFSVVQGLGVAVSETRGTLSVSLS